jgi:hypothetical protein
MSSSRTIYEAPRVAPSSPDERVVTSTCGHKTAAPASCPRADRIMAGIVSIEDGAWFSPNADGDACNSSCVDVTPA